jgi:CO dehydrogenase maturation factor
MKIAVSGKGGVGKSTLAAALALLLARRDRRVLAIDADSDANLAAALGISESDQHKIIPIAEQVSLIEERTGAKVKQYGQIFKLNPEVSDIADKYATYINGVALLVLGGIDKGGGGCACPENVLLRALVTDLILYKEDALIMDMEPGVEHLGRSTARGVDVMLIVVEPGQRSIDSTYRILRMAKEAGLRNIHLIANKIKQPEDEKFIQAAFPEHDIFSFIPYSDQILGSDRSGISVLDNLSEELTGYFDNILQRLEKQSIK